MTGAVQVVRVGDGGRIIGGAKYETSWESVRGDMQPENLGHGRKYVDIPYVLPGQGSPAELTGGGMPRTSGDKDGDASTFCAPACPGHLGSFGGGKHPPPMVTPMRHAGPLVYTKRKSPCHRTVCQGGGAEEVAVSGGLIEGEHGENL